MLLAQNEHQTKRLCFSGYKKFHIKTEAPHEFHTLHTAFIVFADYFYCITLCMLQRFQVLHLAQLKALTHSCHFHSHSSLSQSSCHELIKSGFSSGSRPLLWLAIVGAGLRTFVAPHSYRYALMSLLSSWIALEVADWRIH